MKILIVDDHVYNRDLLRFVLEDLGHECVEADNGLSAIRIFEDERDISLLLMDINMPLMDGIEATREICQLKGQRNATIIFVTALDNAEILVGCLDAGGDDFVPKPINEAVLISKVNAHARNQQTFRRLQLAHSQLQYHQQNIAREHAVIERVFANGLKRQATSCDNLSSYSSPMSMFNGDVLLSASGVDGGEVVIIGDFTGHGLSAAIGSLPVMSMFYELVRRQVDVGEMAREINRQLHRLLPVGLFFCAAIVHLSRDGRRLRIWSGGMNDAVLLNPPGDRVRLLRGDHMPLGILAEAEFDARVQEYEVAAGTRLYIYTDGVSEAKNLQNEVFGEARILSVLTQNSAARVHALTEAVKCFRGEGAQNDDVSIIELLCEECVHRDRTTGAVVELAQPPQALTLLPWKWQARVADSNLRRTGVVQAVVDLLLANHSLTMCKDALFTILNELYSNALDHGILQLDSAMKQTAQGYTQYYQLRQQRLAEINDGCIDIEVAFHLGEVSELHVVVSDSGEGFEPPNLSGLAETSAPFGRGLRRVNSLCSSVEFTQGGRQVRAVYSL